MPHKVVRRNQRDNMVNTLAYRVSSIKRCSVPAELEKIKHTNVNMQLCVATACNQITDCCLKLSSLPHFISVEENIRFNQNS